MKASKQLFWLLAVLLVLPVVHAAGASLTLLQPVQQLLGNGGIGEIYDSSPILWDSILSLVIFISVSMIAFKKVFDGKKAVPVVVGIILAIGFAGFEQASTFRLNQMGPLAALIMFGFFIFIVYYFLHTLGVKNPLIAFLASVVVIFMILKGVNPTAYDKFQTLLGPFAPWLNLLIVVGLIVVIISIFSLIGNAVKGGKTGGGNSSSEDHAAGSLAKNAHQELDKAAKNEQTRQNAEQKAQEAAQALNREMDKLLAETHSTGTDKLQAAKALHEYLRRVKEFVETIHKDVEPNVGKESYKIYESEIGNYREQLKNYFNAIVQAHAELAGYFGDAEMQQMFTQAGNDQNAVRPGDNVAGFVGELAVYNGWLKRRATVLEHWVQQSVWRRAISAAVRTVKDKMDLDITIQRQNQTAFDLIYKTEDLATAMSRESDKLLSTGLPAEAANVFSRGRFTLRLKVVRDMTVQVSNDINGYRQIMTSLRSQLQPAHDAYEKVDIALTKRDTIIKEWTELLDKIGQAISKLAPAVIKYVEQPSSSTYNAAKKPLNEALSDAEKVHSRIEEQARLDAEIPSALAAMKKFESDSSIKPVVDTQFKRLTDLLVRAAETLDRAALVLFETRSYAAIWKVHKDNTVAPSSAIPSPKHAWDRAVALIANTPAGTTVPEAKIIRDYIDTVYQEIARITAEKERSFTEYRNDTVKNIDGLLDAAHSLNVNHQYTSERSDVWNEVQTALDAIKKEWEDLQARLRKITPP